MFDSQSECNIAMTMGAQKSGKSSGKGSATGALIEQDALLLPANANCKLMLKDANAT